MSVDEVAEVDRYETRTVERQERREKVKGLLSSIFTDVLDAFEPEENIDEFLERNLAALVWCLKARWRQGWFEER